MEKTKFYIPGFDEILKGGVISDSTVLLIGSPGTGKSIAAFQFVYNGAKNGIPGLYIVSEENGSSLRGHMSSVGFDSKDLEKKGLLTIVEQAVTSGRMLSMEAPIKLIKKKKIKRVVLDSLTLFEFVYGTSINEFRKGLISFITQMKEAGVTLLVVGERQTVDVDGFEHRSEDSVFDGLVVLSKIRKGSTFERVLHIEKMRGQDHLIDLFPFQIGKGGIKVFPQQIPFSLLERDVLKNKNKK